MKKLILLFLILFLSLTIVSAYDTSKVKVTLLNQDPDPVGQGQVVEVRFKVENTRSETFENVEVEILPEFPFSLYTGDAVTEIGKLRAGQTGADAVIVDYKLKVDSEAVEGDNEIELLLRVGSNIYSYVDDQFMIDVEEYNLPEIKVYLRETDIIQSNSKGTITIEVANVDKADVKFLQMTLLPTDDYNLLSASNYVYLGDVDSDDTESEDFEIFVSDVDGQVSIPVLLQYEDIEEIEHEEKFEINFNVYDSGELSKYGLQKRSYTLTVIVVIVILIVVYFYWKKRRKKE